MRPVDISPHVPPDYDQLGQLEKPSTAYTADNQVLTVREVILRLQGLINSWVANGMRYDPDGEKVFPLPGQAEDYAYLKNRFREGWSDARRALLYIVGQYCSYCEVPLFSHISVEHTLPKSMFPQYALSWPNFLLACPTCNSIKGNSPNQDVVQPPRDTDAAIRFIDAQDDEANYLWPHRYWLWMDDGSRFPYVYVPFRIARIKGLLMGAAGVVAPPDVTRFVNLYQKGALTDWWGKVGTVETNPRTGGTKPGELIGVEIHPNPAASDAVQRAAQRMIDLVNLNRIVESDKSASSVDRRVELRTLAFLKAHSMARLYNQVAKSGLPLLVEAVKRQISATITATGFWGVWFTVWSSEVADGQDMVRGLIQGTAPRTWT